VLPSSLALSTVLLVLTASAAGLAALPADPGGDVPETIAEMARKHASEYTPRAPLPASLGGDPVAINHYLLHDQAVLGRAPMAWVEWARATYGLDAMPAAPRAAADLVHQVLRIDAAVGAPASQADIQEMEAQAAALPAGVRVPFAALVSAVADVYEAQAPLSADLNARFQRDFDIHTPFVTLAQRDLMAARGATIVQELNAFRAATDGLVLDPRATFADPAGLVLLGSSGDDTYAPGGMFGDPVLLVDPAGNDVYLNRAGGAAPVADVTNTEANGLVVSVVLDMAGDDLYSYDGPPSAVQGGSTVGGIGLLVDVAGNDRYLAKATRTISAFFTYIDGGGQGFTYGGFGLQVDGSGDDVYSYDVASPNGRGTWALAQGWGGAGGLGISYDLTGNDDWLSRGLGGSSGSFEGIYTQGTAFFGGVGIMVDAGFGRDVYDSSVTYPVVDYYAQGFGAFGGLGIMFEDGGDDTYSAVQTSTSMAAINPQLNCAYGTGSLDGTGVFVDLGGDDRYYSDNFSPKRAHTMSEGFGGVGFAQGVFLDVGGDDVHDMQAHGAQGNQLSGRGVWDPSQLAGNVFMAEGGNFFGAYLDVGGSDTYIGPGSDGGVWPVGADVNLP
jgi:hypothetical protein